jgi:hypothetical protein
METNQGNEHYDDFLSNYDSSYIVCDNSSTPLLSPQNNLRLSGFKSSTNPFKYDSLHTEITGSHAKSNQNEIIGWENSEKIHSMPSTYLLERSSRFLDSDLHQPNVIMKHLSDCYRLLSLRVKYDNNNTGAALMSPERVEMYVCLWNVNFGRKICVEIQRRGGDSDVG